MANVNMIVGDFPIELKQMIVADAQDNDVSINDKAVSILADAFGVRREPSGMPFRPETGATRMMFGVPPELRTKIRVHAARRGETIRSVVISTLAKHYDYGEAAA